MKKLTDDGLETVTGGKKTNSTEPVTTKEALCPKQNKKTMFNLYSGGRAICQECGEQILL